MDYNLGWAALDGIDYMTIVPTRGINKKNHVLADILLLNYAEKAFKMANFYDAVKGSKVIFNLPA